MPTFNTVNTDFTGGLMDPHLRGRIDLDKFNKGLQRCENFLPSTQGPLHYRSGMKYVDDAPEATKNVKLIDFSINNENRYLIALSEGRLNVYDRSGLLLYERTTDADGNPLPWLDSQIYDIRYSREVEKMIFTHKAWQPYEVAANAIFESVQLFSNDDYDVAITGTDSDGAGGTYSLQVAQVNDANAYTLDGGTHVIEYDNSNAYELKTSGGTVLYTVTLGLGGVDPTTVPLTGWTVDTGSGTACDLTYGLSLGSNDPFDLYAGSVGSAGLSPWTVSKVKFTSHPFEKIDTTDTVFKIKGEAEVVKLVSSASDFSAVVPPFDLTASPRYVEYKTANQWGLGRVLSVALGAPAEPTANVCYIDPVEKVVNVNDPSTRIGIIVGETATEWTINDGVPNGDVHVRADALTFKTSDIGAWVRVGGDKLFTNVADGINFATPRNDGDLNGQDGKVRWAKVIDYRGVEDHPVEFIHDTAASDDFDAGNIYEVYEWGTLPDFNIDATGGTPLERYKLVQGGSSPRFAMDHKLTNASSNAELTSTYSSVIANMSTQRQFDVVEVDNVTVGETIRTEGTDLIVPAGDVSVYDLVTDPDGLASHTATLEASTTEFSAARDEGRFMFGKLITGWVLMQIDTVTNDYSCEVNVFSSIPRDTLTGDITNNGVFTQFRRGAWYTGNWPQAVSYYEQRRIFGGSKNSPNLVWLSKLTDETDFRTTEDDGDVLDTTGITYQLGTSSTIIRWLESGPTLIIGTESNEWQLRPNEFNAAITPSNIRITQETPIGSIIQGMRVGGAVFFPHISGRTLMEFKYDFQTQQFTVITVTKLVPTLFEDDPIKSIAYQLNPNATFWIVTKGGQFFSLTYRKEDDYYAWAKHTTSGLVKDVAVLTKGDEATSEDQVWFVVSRGGVQSLEKLAPNFRDDGADTFRKESAFLDSYNRNPASGYLDTPVTTVSVPDRLISGDYARVVADGVDLGNLSVSAGVAALPFTASKYTLVGLPYDGVIQQNPYAFPSQGGVSYGQIKRLVAMRPYVYKSLTYQVGVSEDELQVANSPNGDSDLTTTELYTGFMEEHGVINAQYGVDESPLIKHNQPYPLVLVSNVQKVEVN